VSVDILIGLAGLLLLALVLWDIFETFGPRYS
jgi:hypothetical protein